MPARELRSEAYPQPDTVEPQSVEQPSDTEQQESSPPENGIKMWVKQRRGSEGPPKLIPRWEVAAAALGISQDEIPPAQEQLEWSRYISHPGTFVCDNKFWQPDNKLYEDKTNLLPPGNQVEKATILTRRRLLSAGFLLIHYAIQKDKRHEKDDRKDLWKVVSEARTQLGLNGIFYELFDETGSYKKPQDELEDEDVDFTPYRQ